MTKIVQKFCKQCAAPINYRRPCGRTHGAKRYEILQYCRPKCADLGRKKNLPGESVHQYYQRLVAPPKANPDECWILTSHLSPHGYGQFFFEKKQYAPHRIAYELSKGPITPGMFIRHTCDTPACNNPKHLIEGTPQQNTEDMMRRHRNRKQLKGWSNEQAKVSYETVRYIVEQNRKNKQSSTVLGKELNLHPRHVRVLSLRYADFNFEDPDAQPVSSRKHREMRKKMQYKQAPRYGPKVVEKVRKLFAQGGRTGVQVSQKLDVALYAVYRMIARTGAYRD